ncbi:MAG: hypothetical protein IIA67_08915 [Planctomycetes bacterium]|nr:hypothetical protein [Planctomycetota bacterium]
MKMTFHGLAPEIFGSESGASAASAGETIANNKAGTRIGLGMVQGFLDEPSN